MNAAYRKFENAVQTGKLVALGRGRMGEQSTLPVVARHGAHRLPSVEVDSYNVELKDNEGFIGDRASRGAFRTLVDLTANQFAKVVRIRLGDEDTEELSKGRS